VINNTVVSVFSSRVGLSFVPPYKPRMAVYEVDRIADVIIEVAHQVDYHDQSFQQAVDKKVLDFAHIKLQSVDTKHTNTILVPPEQSGN
jgi:hypothetical protein